MHLEQGNVPDGYLRYVARKRTLLTGLFLLTCVVAIASVCLGAVRIPLPDVLAALSGSGTAPRISAIVWNIRLPQTLTAIFAGASLALCGTLSQALLRNPLASPFTLGISNAAAFGGAFSIIFLGAGRMQSTVADAVRVSNPLTATSCAFCFSVLASALVLLIARAGRSKPEVMVLAGVALGSLFTAGTMFLQYLADDSQVAAAVFWTFGGVSRAPWRELAIIAVVFAGVFSGASFFALDLNALEAGDETARSLGIPVDVLRVLGMGVVSLLSAVVVAFLGVIGFIGLVAPHMLRRVIGNDHRFLLPASAVAGACLLLAADTAARLVFAPRVLPVSVLTAFLGVPVFLAIILRTRTA